jgi:cytochrome bd ubiquinol oxidase subunit II
VNAATWVAIVLVLAITAYAWLGLADFGAGFWDLTAGGAERGKPARTLIDEVVTPVWEANHVWLIFILVTLWTAFGAAFGPIMTTLFVPMSLAALGIVLRGANFALRKDAARAGARHLAGWLFGAGAVLTPFFLGTALGAILCGRVPADGSGDPVSSWWNPVAVSVGLLTLATGAFLSASYLVVEARKRDESALRSHFQTRAVAAGAVSLACGIVAAITLHGQQRQMFDRFTTRSIPLIVVGVAALVATLLLARRGHTRWLRATAALGVAALVWSWAVAQYPYLLPFTLSLTAGAGASVTLNWVLAWFVVALLVVVPLIILLLVLDQRGELGEDPMMSADGEESRPGRE